jgi:hypothetical protein
MSPIDTFPGGWTTSGFPSRRLGRWLARTRGRRVFGTMIAVWLLSGLDLACMVCAQQFLRFDVSCEANPVAACVMSLGTDALIVFKVTLVAAGSAGAIVFRRRRAVDYAMSGTLVVHVVMINQWWAYFHTDEVQCALTRMLA